MSNHTEPEVTVAYVRGRTLRTPQRCSSDQPVWLGDPERPDGVYLTGEVEVIDGAPRFTRVTVTAMPGRHLSPRDLQHLPWSLAALGVLEQHLVDDDGRAGGEDRRSAREAMRRGQRNATERSARAAGRRTTNQNYNLNRAALLDEVRELKREAQRQGLPVAPTIARMLGYSLGYSKRLSAEVGPVE